MVETREEAARRRAVDLRRALIEIAETRRWHAMNNLERPEGDDLAEVLERIPAEHYAAIRTAVDQASAVEWDASGRRPRVEVLGDVASAAASDMSDPAPPELPDDPTELANLIPRM